jgi:hypothetical protein
MAMARASVPLAGRAHNHGFVAISVSPRARRPVHPQLLSGISLLRRPSHTGPVHAWALLLIIFFVTAIAGLALWYRLRC